LKSSPNLVALRRISIAVLAALALNIAAPAFGQHTTGMDAAQDLPDWFLGTWSRDWISIKGVKSSTLDVHYLQAPEFFVDVRIPTNRPPLRGANSFADLSDSQLRALARQKGFTGSTTVAALLATWHHDIDFQPQDGSQDIGRLEQQPGGAMLEHALDDSYIESWRRRSSGDNRFLVIRTERSGRPERVLVVTGDYFSYVRNRGEDLPAAKSLEALIKASHATRGQIVAYLDCEFSTGRVRGGSVPWEIEHSTLPWREGRRLEMIDDITVSADGKGVASRQASPDHWHVPVNTFAPGELGALLQQTAKAS
jgi:hypothetical protein